MSEGPTTLATLQGASLQDVLDILVQERGGIACFSALQMLAARGLCRIMNAINAGDVSKAGSIQSLIDMLPPKVEVAVEKPWDLSLLTDRQFALLERLGAICRGERPAVPEHRKKSRVHWAALDLAAAVDRIVAQGGTITERDRADLCNAMHDVAYRALQLTPQGFYRALYGEPEWLRPATVPRQVSEPQPVTERAPEPPSNVVPLMRSPPSERFWPDLNPLVSSGVHPCLFDANDLSSRSRGMP